MRFNWQSRRTILVVTALLLILGAGPLLPRSSADKLPNRIIQLVDSKSGVQSNYHFSFELLNANSIGSIRFQFCSDTPIIDFTCTPPTGFDATTGVLSAQTGETGFSIDPSSDVNDIILTRPAQLTTPGTVTYDFTNIQNPTNEGTYFVRLQTYATTDASGPYTDAGGLAFAINSPISISSEVPPYLLLCGGVVITGFDCTTASGDYINFGELSTQATKSATTQLVLATNAGSGYNVYADGSTMTAGNSTIPALTAGDVSRPGTSQFGFNLVDNTTPDVGTDPAGPGSASADTNYAVPDRYRFGNGEQVAVASGVQDFRKFTFSYIVNIATSQPPGIYVTTLSYVAVANF
jgi:hypothetical protein